MKKIILACLAILLQACLALPAAPAAVPTDQSHKRAVLVQPADLVQKQDTAAVVAPITQICAKVTASQSLHLRKAADTMAPVVGYLYNGDQVKILENSSSWWKIESPAGTGYANSRYLQTEVCDAK